MSKSRPKSQQLLLDIIKDEVTTRLEQSLDNRIYIITNKEEDPSQVKPPWAVDIQISSQPTFQLPPNTTITDIYNREDIEGRLLILGAPGSGKTTTLLQLAQDLIAQAEENTKQPIPVLLNLSSWIDNYQSFKTWIIDNLDIKYGISKNTSKQWLNQEIIIPLLDGLDELAPTQQEKCVEQINEFLQLKPNSLHNSNSWSSSLVVCSRTEEYCYLVTQLRLNGSIILQPLTQDQIYNYVLNTIGEELWNTLISVPDLMELVKTPLFLNILALSFQEFSFERWQNLNSSQDKIIELFNIYISTMLNRNYNQQKPENEKTKYWLAWLANQLTQENKTEFFVENISPSWVKNENQKTLYEISLCIISAVIFGCNGVIGGLFFGLFYGFKEYSINGKIARDIINNFRYVLSASTMLGFILSPSLGATPTISPDMYKKLYFPPIIQIKKDYSIEIQTRKVLIKEPVENLVYCNKDTYLSKLETFNKSGINIKTIRVDDYLLCGLIGASCHLLLFWLIRLLTQSNELSQSNESIIINSMQMLFTGFSGFFGGFFIGILPIYLQKVNLKDLKWSFNLSCQKGLILSSNLIANFTFIMTSAILVQILSFSTFNLNYLETLEKITEADGQKIIYTILFSTIYTTFFFVLAGFIVCGFTSSKIQVKKRPNQGVYQSLVNATIIGMIFAILSGTINGLFYGLVYQLSLEKILLLGIIMGFPHGLMGALLSGGMSLLQHFTLRLLLWQDGSIPWNYVHFLDYATNRLFLQKVGGGYRFIHKLLQDHFAQIEFERK